jgi:hypothetical protein
MNNQSNSYCQAMAAQSEQNRQIIMLILLSKLVLVLFIGAIYAGVRILGQG